jgi:hypothetical protein
MKDFFAMLGDFAKAVMDGSPPQVLRFLGWLFAVIGMFTAILGVAPEAVAKWVTIQGGWPTIALGGVLMVLGVFAVVFSGRLPQDAEKVPERYVARIQWREPRQDFGLRALEIGGEQQTQVWITVRQRCKGETCDRLYPHQMQVQGGFIDAPEVKLGDGPETGPVTVEFWKLDKDSQSRLVDATRSWIKGGSWPGIPEPEWLSVYAQDRKPLASFVAEPLAS